MNSESVKHLSLFKDNLIVFMDELISTLPNEGDLIIARIFIKDQIPILDIMNFFIMNFVPLKENILNKDEKVFLESSQLYKGVSPEKIIYYKNLWYSGQLDVDDKNTIWMWFKSFINQCEKYTQSF